ncbi:MAG: DMT family transporter [bacterium]
MNKLAPVFIIIAAALWGIDGIVLRPSLFNLSVPLVVFIESTFATILLSPIFSSRFKKISQLSGLDWLAFLGVAIFGGAVGTMAIVKALFYVNFVNLSIVILIQKLQPVFAILLAAILLKEKLTLGFFLWAGIAIIGAYLMTFGISLPVFSTGDKTLVAALFSLLAAFSFGSSTVFSKRALKNVGFEVGTFLRFFITSFLMLILVLSLNLIGEVTNISSGQFTVFIIIALTTGGPAIFLYYYGLKNISASVATICELAFPLSALILEYFVHGRVLDWLQWVGVAILIFGIYMVTHIKMKNGQ